MRRIIIEEPLSGAALWSRRLAIFALAVAGLGLALSRTGRIDPLSGLAVLACACLVGLASLFLGLSAYVIVWRSGKRGAGVASLGIFLSALLLALPAFMGFQALRLPMLADVATDLVDPPEFSRSRIALSAREGHVYRATTPAMREAQRRTWPSIQPIILDLEIGEASRLVQATLASLKWRVVEVHAPGGRKGRAHVDALESSLLTGLPQDVTIRLIPAAGQTRVDIRSASRIGPLDFGENARRIQRFANEMQAQLDAR